MAKGRPCLVVVVPTVPAKGLVGFELERIQRSFNCFAFGDEGMIVLKIIPFIYVWKNNQAISFILDNYFIVSNAYIGRRSPLQWAPVSACDCVLLLCLCCLSLCSSRVSVSLLCLRCVSVSLLVLKPCVCVSQCSSRVSLSLFVLEPCVCVSLGARAVCLCLS